MHHLCDTPITQARRSSTAEIAENQQSNSSSSVETHLRKESAAYQRSRDMLRVFHENVDYVRGCLE
jgi:hypothetical protein